ncbi:HD domain-containing protein [Lojkania enalia]|uniref:HD domain-containing protein n=1 Tax=Lojkania enalia TaxID=147567 RepID=A0A9P4N4S3_9PLEO|nr:HD domain-containing protein [Didymosphaeria enalia]
MCNYDNSHNWEHIQQVVANADLIYSRELETNKAWTETLDPVLIVLGCILHDVADHKYHKSIPQEGLKDLTLNLLLSCGVEPSLAEKVDIIANNVSYSKERQYAEDIKTILAEHPELAIVQDADRVDALGARGQARCFAYHGADETFRMESMQTSVQHHWEKLCKLPASMKTETGRQLGEDGWKALCWMRRWWDMECGRLERVLG